LNQTSRPESVKVKLPNGADIRVEVTPIPGGEGAVSFAPGMPDFQPLIDAIEGIATAVNAALQRVKPQQASVELGLEVGVEAGKLTALLVQGSGKANLKVTLSWQERG
jgi:NTP-dependent ternary system trypsin peptidase co-occuring protein